MANNNILLNVADKVLFEYIYNNKIISPTVKGFRKVYDPVDKINIIVNENNAISETGNTVDNTVVELEDGNVALLDNDTAFWYPAVNPDVTVTNLTFINSRPLAYDTIRVHMVSGYNFDQNKGFVVSVYAKTSQNKIVKLCNYAWTKDNSDQLYFAPRPKIIDVQVFDKYVELSIPSLEYMLAEQNLNPTNPDNLAYQFTDGGLLSSQHTLYCMFQVIKEKDQIEDGFTKFNLEQGKKFAFSSLDEYSLLTADITEDPGGFFKYSAKWNGQAIEDFIYSLNSLAGNNYYLIHEVVTYLQTGSSFVEVENFTEFQKDDYQKEFLYRPVIPTASYATAIAVDYNVRLYNAANGNNVLKSASYSTFNVNKYGKNLAKLNVGDVTRPLVAVNKVFKNEVTVNNPVIQEPPPKVAYVFVDNNSLRLKDNTTIQVNPFDNIFKFNITQYNRPLELDEVNTYYMVFLLSNGSKLYVVEMQTIEHKKSEGELIFKLDASKAKQVLGSTNNSFYVIAKSPNSVESFLVGGFWQREPLEVSIPATVFTPANVELVSPENLTPAVQPQVGNDTTNPAPIQQNNSLTATTFATGTNTGTQVNLANIASQINQAVNGGTQTKGSGTQVKGNTNQNISKK